MTRMPHHSFYSIDVAVIFRSHVFLFVFFLNGTHSQCACVTPFAPDKTASQDWQVLSVSFSSYGFSFLWLYSLKWLLLCSLKGVVSERCTVLSATGFESDSVTGLTHALYRIDRDGGPLLHSNLDSVLSVEAVVLTRFCWQWSVPQLSSSELLYWYSR